MMATVLSWDGYLASIEGRPLYGFWRFAIDIALVFIYMFLLMTSNHKTWWLTIHAITYTLYICWDLLSVREYTYQFLPDLPADKLSTSSVYRSGFSDKNDASKGPIITIAWALYFWLLVTFNNGILSRYVFLTTIFAISGLTLYRFDKGKRYSMGTRLCLIVALIGLDTAIKFICPPLTDENIYAALSSLLR